MIEMFWSEQVGDAVNTLSWTKNESYMMFSSVLKTECKSQYDVHTDHSLPAEATDNKDRKFTDSSI